MKKFILIITVIFLSCSAGKDYYAKNIHSQTGSRWHQLAIFLSGLPVAPENKFYSLSQTLSYSKHSSFMDDIWKQISDNAYSKMKKWHSALPLKSNKTVLYPLSGADFLNVFTLFPESSRYIMIALEKPGDPLKLSSIDKHKLELGLRSLRYLIYTYAKGNYFTSKMMNIHMKNPYLTGVLPVLMITMPRLNLYINEIEVITIDKNGSIIPVQSDDNEPKGLRIIFYSPQKPYKRELVYLNMRIENSILSPSINTGKFFQKLPRHNTMLKSAVYLFHNPKYDEFKDFLLEKSSAVIQDDSGIPYKSFTKDKWNVHLYGHFDKPLRLKYIFPPNPVQPELASEYKKRTPRALPFCFGYGCLRRDKKSNLIYAEKK